MKELMRRRRYLIDFSTYQLAHILTDVVVIGSGVAGLRTAIEASKSAHVLVLAKSSLDETATARAQGGVAVVLSPSDSLESHIADTLRTGQGLCDLKTVETVVREGPERIRELIDWGAVFDHEKDELAFTKEGGHSLPRIVHARGDATGAEIQRVLLDKARSISNIRFEQNTFAIDLVTSQGVCHGVLIYDARRGVSMVWARQVVVATGGVGQIYRETTNPEIATGDGHAMCYRAGAVLRDMEFVQFHPTTLYVAGASRALISEAVRGEGGILRNKHGERFMPKYHPMAELAPRDVVSRSIVQEMRRTNATHVYLDITHLPRELIDRRFPMIKDLCRLYDIDVYTEMIPVRPSAHYMVGGVKANLIGETSIQNLFVCGEVASTGLHGANRLGSNSLLEGLVFGKRVGEEAGRRAQKRSDMCIPHPKSYSSGAEDGGQIDLEDVTNSLKSLMWRDIGIQRSEARLREANQNLDFWGRYVFDRQFATPEGWQLQNMLSVAKLITVAALERRESRGTHFRSDCPESLTEWERHIELKVERDKESS